MSSKSREIKHLKMDMEVGEIPFREYPRPQLYRDSAWKNLNGSWDCGVLVPFPLESDLSGFSSLPDHSGIVPEEYDYYTTFEYHYSGRFGAKKNGHRVLLHFGAVDQICNVYIDDVFIGHHEGGYLPFYFDVTDILAKEGSHKLNVHVIDSLDIRFPYGKQSRTPGGMWYTPVSGIWQTVWLEEVPKAYIRGLVITPFERGVRFEVDGEPDRYTVELFEPVMGFNPASVIARPVDMTDSPKSEDIPHKELKVIYRDTFDRNKKYIEIEDPHYWSPDSPYLYGIRVSSETDTVTSYFALRIISIERINKQKRILLNGKPIFFHGVLDQGYYPEGIFLPNNEEGYVRDIENMKEMGFNTLRKHIKIEHPAFYVACDVKGMMVWQDMVNNSDYNFLRDTILPTFGIKAKTDLLTHLNHVRRMIFRDHMVGTIKYLYNFPCICYYTIFNEGWGQFDSDRLYRELKELDPTRVIDSTSGWFRQFQSDVVSRHVYFRKIMRIRHHHPVMISEFGGYNYSEKDHSFNLKSDFGYKGFNDKKELEEAIIKLYQEQIIPYISYGCSGSIYTQLSDVEDETNGLYTYDRKICKVDRARMRQIAEEIRSELEKCTK